MDVATTHQIISEFIAKMFKKFTWKNIFVTVLILVIFLLTFSPDSSEGFAGLPTFDVNRDDAVYDDFYVNIYDDIAYCKEKENFEIDTFLRATKPNEKESKILDIGSGTGHHVNALTTRGFSVTGIDKSSAMINEARMRYPESLFIHDDAVSPIAFPPGYFTHITSFFFTVYYFKNKRDYFKNCYNWLAPGGFMLVHLVNRSKFAPTIAANPATVFSAQKGSSERPIKSKITVSEYDYQSEFDYDAKSGNATLTEELINHSAGSIRKNEHRLYMPRQQEILEIAISVGFKVKEVIEMTGCHYNTHYLYVLQK